MLNYIIQVVSFQLLFLLFYDLLLSKETFFQKNRVFLVSAILFSFILPELHFKTIEEVVVQSNYEVVLTEIVLNPETIIQETNLYESLNYFKILYWFGVLVSTFLLFVKIFKLYILLKNNKKQKKESYTYVSIEDSNKAFSFFNFVCIGDCVSNKNKLQIVAHELVHVKHRHSLDLLFFELIKIAMWFNPLVYLYQKRLAILHEFIADAESKKHTSVNNYINSLVSDLFSVENISFTNQFYKSLFIKKRIIMIKKAKSNQRKLLKFLVLIPVLLSMLVYTSCLQNESDIMENKKQLTARYFNTGKEIITSVGGKETFLDNYFGSQFPNWAQVSYEDLSNEEKKEYEDMYKKIVERNKKSYGDSEFKFFKKDDGRKVFATKYNQQKSKSIDNNISFMNIEKAPTFPGCPSGDKDCFTKGIQNHFKQNFNFEMVSTLELTPGKKRAYLGFIIDEDGNMGNITVRAPHKKIKEKLTAIAATFPKVIPGESNGEKVSIKYAIPFTIMVN